MMKIKHPNRRAYNWLAYNINEQLLQRCTKMYKGTLYDLGAGESPYKYFFLQYADSYIAVDWAESLHDTNADIIADLNKTLPIESDMADVVVSLSVMEHLYEPQTMLNEAYRILKPGGDIILQVPWQWWVHEAPHDYFRYTTYGLQYLFKTAGFENIVIEPQTGYFTTAVLKWNYFTNRFVRGPAFTRWIINACLIPFWYIGQKISPLLDKLDRKWSLETAGYFVAANKPKR